MAKIIDILKRNGAIVVLILASAVVLTLNAGCSAWQVGLGALLLDIVFPF